MVLSRKPEAVNVPNPRLDPLPTGIPVIQPVPEPGDGRGGRGGDGDGDGGGRGGAGRGGPPPPPGAGAAGETFLRATGVAGGAEGNIYVGDGDGNAPGAKYQHSGRGGKNREAGGERAGP